MVGEGFSVAFGGISKEVVVSTSHNGVTVYRVQGRRGAIGADNALYYRLSITRIAPERCEHTTTFDGRFKMCAQRPQDFNIYGNEARAPALYAEVDGILEEAGLKGEEKDAGLVAFLRTKAPDDFKEIESPAGARDAWATFVREYVLRVV